MYRTDNPLADFNSYDAEQQAYEDRLPKCDECGETIDEYLFDIDGEILCEECLREKYRHNVESYMRED